MTISTSLWVKPLIASHGQGGGTLAVVDEALTNGPKHGYFVVALLERSSLGAALFFLAMVASWNMLARTFFMPTKDEQVT